MKKTRCFSVLSGRLGLPGAALGAAALLSGALLLADVLVNAGGGSSNADKTGNGGGTLDYGRVTFSGSASYDNNTVRGFSQGGAVYAGSVVQQAAVSFSGNRAEQGSGGAMYSRGNVQIAAGSSFSGNAAAHNGGALCLDANDGEDERTVSVEGGCTFSGNSAGNLGGAVYVSGNSAAAPTVLNLRSTDSSRPVSFSGNFRGRSVGASSGGVPNSITVMGHVRMVAHADRDCLVSMEDPLYSFAGYSSTSSLRKTGDGTLGFGDGVSLCHFPVSVEGGTVRLGTNAVMRGMTRLDVAAGACLSFSLPRDPGREAKWSAEGPVSLDGGAEVHVALPAMDGKEREQSWKLVEGTTLSMAALPSVSYDAASAEAWKQAGGFSLKQENTAGKSALVLAWTRTPSPYDQWKKDHFPDGTPEDQTAPDACPAGDGITNLMKYATGLDPDKPCGSVTALAAREENGGCRLALEWPVNPAATDVTFSVESSEDLVSWREEAVIEPSGNRAEYLDTVVIDGNAPARRFLRLKVTRE